MLRRLLPLVLVAALVALVATSVLLVRSQGRAADLEQQLSQEQARVEEQADRIDEQAEQVEELFEQVAVLERSQGPLGAYCDTLSAVASDIIAPLEASDPGVFSAAFEAFYALSDQAPEEVEDDWAVVVGNVQEMEAAFAAAGLDLDDLGAMSAGEIPEGLDPDRLAGLLATLEGLEGEDLDAAMAAIERHALRACGIDLAG